MVYQAFFFTGFRLIIQSIGFVYLKPNKDPIEGVQQLDYLKMVSINQKLTDKQKVENFQNTQWNDLSKSEQHQFYEAYNAKTVDSEVTES